MSERELGVGMIGNPHRWIGPICGARYVAGCDVNESVCAEARQRFDVVTCTDYRQLVARPDVDLVMVRTPNFVHKAPTLAALEAGKHVFCEKPLALSMDDCREMVAAAERHDRRLQINLELRSSVIPRRMKAILDAGEIGTVRRVLFHHYQGAWDQGPGHWRMDLQKSGGLFPEKLVHEVDLFRWFAGEIEAVQSFFTDNVLPQSPYPDCVQSIFWFAGGAMGSMLHTQTRSALNVPPERFDDYGHELWFDVIGTDGAMRADHWSGRIDVYHHVPGDFPGSRQVVFARREDYAGLGMAALAHDTPGHFAEFVRRLLAGEPELQPPADVLKTMAATFAAERSIRTGRREIVA